MANFFDYLNWREDISFKVSPLNEIDNLILSEIAYMDYENIVSSFPSSDKISFKQATNTLFKVVNKEDIVLGLIVPNDIIELADEMKNTAPQYYFNVGERVFHDKLGVGHIADVIQIGESTMYTIDFGKMGKKAMDAAYAHLKKF